MARRVVLHVGTMKSGTSYLQSLLFAQQAALRDAGVLVPGSAWSDQMRGVKQVLARGPHPAWERLVEEIAAHPGDAVVSMEFLGPAGDKQAARVLGALAPATVEVVVTARDLNRTLVSMWQETVQNGRSWTWEEYVDGAAASAPGNGRGVADRETAAGTFWRQQHLARIVGDWAARVGAERTTLVTLPPPGADRSVLPTRFAEAAGLPIDTAAPVPVANESLGLASVLMLREVNEALTAQGLAFPQGTRLRKKVLAKTALAALTSDEPRLGLEVTDWVRTQTAATVETLRGSGVRLVGTWDDLDPVTVRGASPAEVDTTLVARAAVTGLVEVIADQVRRASH